MVLSRLEIPKHSGEMTAIIEVSKGGNTKYEIDKLTGLLRVDRILHTPMAYPVDYGYFPNTLGDDGDPLDAVVICNGTLRPGTIISVRPIGALKMEDQAGMDEKIICVPITKVDPFHKDTNEVKDLPPILKAQIEHFFKHYKDLEPKKWTKLHGWANSKEARKIIEKSIKKYKETKV